MEREFLGFSSKNSPWTTMKEDASNKPKDQVRSSGMQWSFSNKVSNLPQFMSFKNNTNEDRSRNSVMDPVASSGYMTISTKDVCESNQKSFLGVTQENLAIKQVGNKHGITIYPMQSSDAQSVCNQEARTFSVSNQSNHVINGINMVNSVTNSQTFGSKSSATPLSVFPSKGPIVGSTDLRSRNCSKSNGTTPAQLTIFYGGTVCVYDDISPEKAKAIMLLAGNGTKMQQEISIPSKKDSFIIGQPYPSPLPNPIPMTSHASTQPRGGSSSNNEVTIIRTLGPSIAKSSHNDLSHLSPLPSPLPMTSHASSYPKGGSSSNNEVTIIRSLGPSNAPTNHLESPIVATSVGSTPTNVIQPVGLPQARKASLTRFLEKRKERAMSTSPYYMSKKSPECSTGSDNASFSIDFSSSSTQPPTNLPLRRTCMEVIR